MARYSWPRDYVKSPDRLLRREEHNLKNESPGLNFFDHDELNAFSPDTSPSARPSWLPLGPSMLLQGGVIGDPMVAGRIRDLKINHDGTRAYAGSAKGGVWYWTQDHGVWRPVGSWGLDLDKMENERANISLTVGALSVQFGKNPDGTDNASKDIVYVGTGELKPRAPEKYSVNNAGIGILKLKHSFNIEDEPGGNPWELQAPNLLGSGIYRLARRPEGLVISAANPDAKIVAATSNGLFYRKELFESTNPDKDWEEVDKELFKTVDGTNAFEPDEEVIFTDAVWHSTEGLWVTAVALSKNDGLFHSPFGPAGPFTQIELEDTYYNKKLIGPSGSRYAISFPVNGSSGELVNDRIYILGKRRGGNFGYSTLWRVDNLTSPKPLARLVNQVPTTLFNSGSSEAGSQNCQAWYDMAITSFVDNMTSKDILYIGGACELESSGRWNAALFKLEIESVTSTNYTANFSIKSKNAAAEDPTYSGKGIHADVHQLIYRPNGLWVACDGGVFRAEPVVDKDGHPMFEEPILDKDGNPKFTDNKPKITIHAHNAGLSVVEAGYIDTHSKLEGSILAGLQDNGIMQRTGDTVWHVRAGADGGGVAYHPNDTRLYLKQTYFSDWAFYKSVNETEWPSPDTNQVLPDPLYTIPAGEQPSPENEAASVSFFSRPCAEIGPGNFAQVCFGTDKIWYCSNWGDERGKTNWEYIPASIKCGKIEVVHIADAGEEKTLSGRQAMDGVKILAMSKTSVSWFTYLDEEWTNWAGAKISGKQSKEKYGTENLESLLTKAPEERFLDFLPNDSDLIWTDATPHNASQRSCYVTTSGKIKKIAGGGPPTIDKRYDTLWWYDGNGRWYHTGLVEAVINLAGDTAGVVASAVSVIVDPDGIANFDNDANMLDGDREDYVYVGTKIGIWRGRLTFKGNPSFTLGSTEPQWVPEGWNWEPYFDGMPQAVVEDLNFHVDPDKNLKLLRAAITSRGIWELDLSPGATTFGRTYVRSYNLDTGRRPITALLEDPYSGELISDPHAQSPDIIAMRGTIHNEVKTRWISERPNEAEFFTFGKDVTRDTPPYEPSLLTSLPLAKRPTNAVYVLVHHRDIKPISASDITVHLFAWTNPPYEADNITAKPLKHIPVTQEIRQAMLNTVNGSPTSEGNLIYLDSKHPNKKIDARMPRPVKFEIELPHDFTNGREEDNVLLIAVVDSPNNRLDFSDTAPNNLLDVTLTSSLIAISRFNRSIGRIYLQSNIGDTGHRPIALPPEPRSLNIVASPLALDTGESDLQKAKPPTLRQSANVAYIRIQHTQIEPISKSDVTVHLFALKNPPYKTDEVTPKPLKDIPLTPSMRQFILDTIAGAPPTPLAADKLLHLESKTLPQNVEDPTPQSIQFEFDLDYPFESSRTKDTVILIAVIDSPWTETLMPADLAHSNLVDVISHNSLITASRFKRE